MKAPFDCQPKKVAVLGKTYRETKYKPQFAIGLVCLDERDQQRLYRRLSRLLPGREIKVLVI